MRYSRVFFLLLSCSFSTVYAGVGDPTLRTDHPHYAGEGAFQTAEDCVHFATRGVTGEQDRALAVYQWLLAHQFHLHSPQECFVPGALPGKKQDDYEMVVYDAARGRFSYGYGLCGTVHAWNEVYWRALGMNARRRAFPGHTNSEIEYGGAWHAFDTDMAGLVFRKDGVVAGYEDIIKDPSIVGPNKLGIPYYPFAWPSDFNGMKQGWSEIARKPDGWFKMYNSGYEALPGIVNLRRGETFTRYFDRDHFGGPTKRRFWHVQKGGPFRDWTFVNNGTPKHEGEASNSRGNASYCNAEFVYEPDFKSDAWREGVHERSPNLNNAAVSPLLRGDGKPAMVAFSHFSPYVICGDPADDENPMTGGATGGLVVSGKAVGAVALEISTNRGQSWQSLGDLDGPFERDLTEQVKGRYGWWLRFQFAAGAGLDALKFTTVCQMNQAIYPRLKPGGASVSYRAASRVVAPVVPDFGLSEKELERIEVKSLRSANMKYAPRSATQRLAYTTTNNKAGQVVFRIDAPLAEKAAEGGLVEVAAAARFQLRVPPPAGCDFKMELSLDEGKTWRPFAKAAMPADNEYSSGWMYGNAKVTGMRMSALVRVNLYAGGYTTGLIAAELYGIHRTPPPTACDIAYGWKENSAAKQHIESIKAGEAERTFRVPTGPAVVDDFVRISVP
jgi:hypothetical protein